MISFWADLFWARSKCAGSWGEGRHDVGVRNDDAASRETKAYERFDEVGKPMAVPLTDCKRAQYGDL